MHGGLGAMVCTASLLLGGVLSLTVTGDRHPRSDDFSPVGTALAILSQQVDHITAKLTAQETEMTGLKTSLTAKEVEITGLKSRLSAQETEIAALKNNYVAAQARQTGTPTAFSVTFRSQEVLHLSRGRVLKFDKVLYNAGLAYDSNTGVFTAPANGTYLFFALLAHNENQLGDDFLGSWLEADLVKNDARLVSIAACCSEMDSGSNMVTVPLQQGDKVWLKVAQGESVYGDSFSSFSGHLLTAQ